MKTITKILWGLISGAICMIYELDNKLHISINQAEAGCSYSYVSVTDLSTNQAGNPTVCSASTVCPDNSCATKWVSNPDDAERLADAVTEDVCEAGYYVSECLNSGGTTIQNPTNASGCMRGFACVVCPSQDGGTGTSTASTLNRRSAITNGSFIYDSYIYVCSNNVPQISSATTYDRMYKIRLECAEEVTTAIQTKKNCYLKKSTNYTDTLGTYQFTSDCYYTE